MSAIFLGLGRYSTATVIELASWRCLPQAAFRPMVAPANTSSARGNGARPYGAGAGEDFNRRMRRVPE